MSVAYSYKKGQYTVQIVVHYFTIMLCRSAAQPPIQPLFLSFETTTEQLGRETVDDGHSRLSTAAGILAELRSIPEP